MAGLLSPDMDDMPGNPGNGQAAGYVSLDTIAAHQAMASAPQPGTFASPRFTDMTGDGPSPYLSDASARPMTMGMHNLEDTGLTPQRAYRMPASKPGASFDHEALDTAELASKHTAQAAGSFSSPIG